MTQRDLGPIPPCYFLAVWRGASYLTSLNLHFLTWKEEMRILSLIRCWVKS